jgi:hypothetical protein
LRSACEKSVVATRCCPSIVYRVTWLKLDLCPITSCGMTMERCNQPQPLSQIEMKMRTGWEYDPDSIELLPLPKMQNFYRLLATSDKKVHDGTDVTILQVVTRLMALKLKYNFSNKCYNDIIKLIIRLIPSKHSMLKDLYQSKKMEPKEVPENLTSEQMEPLEKVEA